MKIRDKELLMWLAVIFVLATTYVLFGQSSSVYKDPSNKLLQTEYAKWNTIDLPMVDSGTAVGVTIRVRIDQIAVLIPKATPNSKGGWSYSTEILLANCSYWMNVNMPYDQLATKLLNQGWGYGAPTVYVHP